MALEIIKVLEWVDSGEIGKILVELQVGLDDFSFKEFPPIVRVFVSSEIERDEKKVEKFLESAARVGSYVSVATPAAQRTLPVSMPYKSNGKKLPPVEKMWVLVVPDGDWRRRYPIKWFPVEVRRGQTVNLSISLTPIERSSEREPDSRTNAATKPKEPKEDTFGFQLHGRLANAKAQALSKVAPSDFGWTRMDGLKVMYETGKTYYW